MEATNTTVSREQRQTKRKQRLDRKHTPNSEALFFRETIASSGCGAV
jgi:hypothetical protein